MNAKLEGLVIPMDIINTSFHLPTADPVASLAAPPASLLAKLIESRLRAEDNPAAPKASLPAGVRLDLRPRMPRIGMAALMLYTNRQAVDSFPLIYTTLALAHPN